MRWPVLAVALALIALLALSLSREHARARRAAAKAGQDATARGSSDGPDADSAAKAASPPPAPARPETVAVEVVSAPDNRPVAGARVEAWDGERVAAAAVTDSRGLASLTVNRAGGAHLVAYCRGFVPASYWLYEEEREIPTIVLRPGLAVDGLVTLLDNGQPAADAPVLVRWPENTYLLPRTDSRGRFEIQGVEVGKPVLVVARYEGYEPVEVQYAADPASPHLEIVLGHGGTCEGRVVDEAGLPVADAFVRIGPDNPWQCIETRSDAEGRFTARGLAESLGKSGPEERRVRAQTADHRSGMSEPFRCTPDAPVHRCEIVVRPHAHVAVTLTFPDGSPVVAAGVAVSARESDSSDQRWCAPVAGTPGLFESGPVDPGEPQLRVEVRGWPFQTRGIRVSPGIRNDITFRLEEKLGLEGVAVDREGRGLRGIRVDFDEPHTGPDDRVGIAYTFTDPDGRFRLRGLEAAGGRLAFADYDSDARYATLSMEATPGQPPVRAVLDRRPRVVGRLDPVPEVRVVKTSICCGDEWTGRDIKIGRDGGFEMRCLPVGREFWLRLEVEGLVPWIFLGLTLAPDEKLDLGILRPLDGVTVEGVVTDQGGRPLANAEVVAESEIEDLNVCGGACTDALGRFSIPRLADVTLLVRAEAQGCVPRKVRITRPGASLLTIALEAGGTLEIRGADDEPVEVESLDGREGATVTAEDGGADVALVPGRYRIDDRTFEVRVGETTRVDLER